MFIRDIRGYSAFYNVVKRIYDTFVPASSQNVSPSTRREPALPAPQANFCPDEATTGTSVPKRSASSLMLRDALTSRSLTAPHCSHVHSRSSSARSSLIHPHVWQVLLEGYHRLTSWTYPPYCSVL